MKFSRHTLATTRSAAASRLHQGGMSYPMMAIFLAVAALVIIGAILYGTRYFTKSKVSNEIAAITDQKANVVAHGSRVGLFTSTNSSLTALANQNFFPEAMVSGTVAAPVVTNQWGGSITVTVGTIATAGDSLVFTRIGIPDAACTELGTGLDSVASVIAINGTQVKANGAATNPATVATSCVSSDNNSVALTLAK